MNHFLNGWKGSKEGCEWREDVPSGFPPIDPSELVTSGCGKLIDPLWNWSFSLKWNIRFGLGFGGSRKLGLARGKSGWARNSLSTESNEFLIKKKYFCAEIFFDSVKLIFICDKINSKFRVFTCEDSYESWDLNLKWIVFCKGCTPMVFHQCEQVRAFASVQVEWKISCTLCIWRVARQCARVYEPK